MLAPLLWLSVAYPLEDGMNVIDRAASLLLHHGSPYLPASQVVSWLSYNPYLPVMTLFGLPSAAGRPGRERRGVDRGRHRDPAGRGVPGRGPVPGRPGRPPHDALLATGVAVASPVVGLNLAVITTDPPVLALILLALALAARPSQATVAAEDARATPAVAVPPSRVTGALGAGPWPSAPPAT